MARYKTRRGVVLTEICGSYVLVSARANFSLCPYVTEINDSSAFLWKELVNGADEQELCDAVSNSFEVADKDNVRCAIRGFIDSMLEMNYLVVDE